jgi:Protein of unknown function (DUF2971)
MPQVRQSCHPRPKDLGERTTSQQRNTPKSNIVFSRMKVARFRELNDPFELLFLIARGPRQRAQLEKHNTHVNNTFGVLCFSEDWIDPVLWSHYGSKHRGIALGFDLDEGDARKVTYQSKRMDFPSEIVPEDVLKHLATKFESWEYEREWRIFTPLQSAQQDGGMYFEPFSQRMRLREIILGPMCPLPLDDVRELVNTRHRDVVTIQSRLANKFYRIVPKESTVPFIARAGSTAMD